MQQFQAWVDASLQQPHPELEQTIRIVNEAEARELNHRFRAKDFPTNVLAFPGDSEHLDYEWLVYSRRV